MNRKERVVLLTDLKNIGKKGEVKEVGEAFVRNFLLPRQKVLLYSKSVDWRIQQQQTKFREQEELKKSRNEVVFTSINQRKLSFLLREKNGKTFGSVTASMIIRALKENFNLQFNKEDLLNFKPLKQKGNFPIEIRVSRDSTARLQITIENS